MEKKKVVNIQACIADMEQGIKHRQRLGVLTPLIGYPLILSFSIFLLPVYLYLVVLTRFYFWIRNQKQMDAKPFFNYDRHKVPHLSFLDKVWCEYCEWANGTLQWCLAFTNEIERRYCPIKNKHPHCPKAWREEFLPFEHSPEDLEKYYREQYPKKGYEQKQGSVS